MMTLKEAVELITIVTKSSQPWHGRDFGTDGYNGPIDEAIAIVLNAIANGELVIGLPLDIGPRPVV